MLKTIKKPRFCSGTYSPYRKVRNCIFHTRLASIGFQSLIGRFVTGQLFNSTDNIEKVSNPYRKVRNYGLSWFTYTAMSFNPL